MMLNNPEGGKINLRGDKETKVPTATGAGQIP